MFRIVLPSAWLAYFVNTSSAFPLLICAKIIVNLFVFRLHPDPELVRGDALLVDGGDHALVLLIAVAEVPEMNVKE